MEPVAGPSMPRSSNKRRIEDDSAGASSSIRNHTTGSNIALPGMKSTRTVDPPIDYANPHGGQKLYEHLSAYVDAENERVLLPRGNVNYAVLTSRVVKGTNLPLEGRFIQMTEVIHRWADGPIADWHCRWGPAFAVESYGKDYWDCLRDMPGATHSQRLAARINSIDLSWEMDFVRLFSADAMCHAQIRYDMSGFFTMGYIVLMMLQDYARSPDIQWDTIHFEPQYVRYLQMNMEVLNELNLCMKEGYLMLPWNYGFDHAEWNALLLLCNGPSCILTVAPGDGLVRPHVASVYNFQWDGIRFYGTGAVDAPDWKRPHPTQLLDAMVKIANLYNLQGDMVAGFNRASIMINGRLYRYDEYIANKPTVDDRGPYESQVEPPTNPIDLNIWNSEACTGSLLKMRIHKRDRYTHRRVEGTIPHKRLNAIRYRFVNAGLEMNSCELPRPRLSTWIADLYVRIQHREYYKNLMSDWIDLRANSKDQNLNALSIILAMVMSINISTVCLSKNLTGQDINRWAARSVQPANTNYIIGTLFQSQRDDNLPAIVRASSFISQTTDMHVPINWMTFQSWNGDCQNIPAGSQDFWEFIFGQEVPFLWQPASINEIYNSFHVLWGLFGDGSTYNPASYVQMYGTEQGWFSFLGSESYREMLQSGSPSDYIPDGQLAINMMIQNYRHQMGIINFRCQTANRNGNLWDKPLQDEYREPRYLPGLVGLRLGSLTTYDHQIEWVLAPVILGINMPYDLWQSLQIPDTLRVHNFGIPLGRIRECPLYLKSFRHIEAFVEALNGRPSSSTPIDQTYVQLPSLTSWIRPNI